MTPDVTCGEQGAEETQETGETGETGAQTTLPSSETVATDALHQRAHDRQPTPRRHDPLLRLTLHDRTTSPVCLPGSSVASGEMRAPSGLEEVMVISA